MRGWRGSDDAFFDPDEEEDHTAENILQALK
jgi:hypothetical protein